MKKSKKLNLGCGKDYREGWINIDVSSDFKIDLIANLNKKFPYANNDIDEILASDILEHFTKEKGELFLGECYRVLKDGGILTLRTHNIYKIFTQFKNNPLVLIHFLYGDTQETDVFGSHKYAYTEESLKLRLKIIGFDIISFEEKNTNFVITARKRKKEEKELRIAIIQQSPDMGGAETYMLSLIKHFLNNKDEIFLATNRGKFLSTIKELPVTSHEIPFFLDIIGNYRGLIKSFILFPYALFFYIKLLKSFKKKGIDVILMSGFSEKLLITFLSLFIKIPVVWIEYGRLEKIFKRNFYLPKVIYRLLKNIPKKIIVPSRNTMESLIVDARVSLEKLAFVPLGITQVKIKNHKSSYIKQKYPNKFIIGNVSRLTKEKGQEYLIRAMSSIIKKYPQTHLIIIGDGPDKAYYLRLVSELQLEDSITITGYEKNLTEYYAAMDIFVFPTVWDLEGFGLVAVEAMSHHLPIVASKTGPVPEIVVDDVTGILVPPKDPKELAKAIIALIDNPQKRKQFGENGYKKFVKNYKIEKSSSKIRQILYEATVN